MWFKCDKELSHKPEQNQTPAIQISYQQTAYNKEQRKIQYVLDLDYNANLSTANIYIFWKTWGSNTHVITNSYA